MFEYPTKVGLLVNWSLHLWLCVYRRQTFLYESWKRLEFMPFRAKFCRLIKGPFLINSLVCLYWVWILTSLIKYFFRQKWFFALIAFISHLLHFVGDCIIASLTNSDVHFVYEFWGGAYHFSCQVLSFPWTSL